MVTMSAMYSVISVFKPEKLNIYPNILEESNNSTLGSLSFSNEGVLNGLKNLTSTILEKMSFP